MELVLSYPVLHVGGAQKLLVTFASNLYKLGVIDKIIVFDIEGGYVSSELVKFNVSLDIHDVSRIDLFSFSKDAIFLVPFSEIKTLAKYKIDPHLKLIFWAVHPFGFSIFAKLGMLYRNLPFSGLWRIVKYIEPSRFKALKNIVSYSCSKDGFWIMDLANQRFGERLGFDLGGAKMVPIGIDVSKKSKLLSEDFIRCKRKSFGWIGRLDKDKYYSLRHVLRLANDAASLQGDKLDFYIIGNGHYMAKVLKLRYPFLQIKCVGFLEGSVLDRFLLENVRIAFAMGTSVLEAASLAVSVVVVDCLVRPIRGVYSNTYLMNRQSPYYLGDMVHSESEATVTRDYVYQLLSTDECLDYAAKCQELVKSHFDMRDSIRYFSGEMIGGLPCWGDIRSDVEYLFCPK